MGHQLHLQEPQHFIGDIAVNFHGPYYLMRLLVPTFREQRSGCVLNIASRAGTVDIPFSTSYCASKAALINLTACTQKECDVEGYEDIHLYALHPGGVRSEMTVKSRIAPYLPKISYHTDSVSLFRVLRRVRRESAIERGGRVC
jgi:NAD(P)-dependent dehydrogenase (short-subunit alcohol dehydrogenase family)